MKGESERQRGSVQWHNHLGHWFTVKLDVFLNEALLPTKACVYRHDTRSCSWHSHACSLCLSFNQLILSLYSQIRSFILLSLMAITLRFVVTLKSFQQCLFSFLPKDIPKLIWTSMSNVCIRRAICSIIRFSPPFPHHHHPFINILDRILVTCCMTTYKSLFVPLANYFILCNINLWKQKSVSDVMHQFSKSQSKCVSQQESQALL